MNEDSIGKRVGRFITLLSCVFALTVGVVATQRLSADALALLIGLACGVAALLPTFALGIFMWRREETQRHAHPALPSTGTTAAAPPVIVVTPSLLPGYGMSPRPALNDAATGGLWAWDTAPAERKFTVVGGEE